MLFAQYFSKYILRLKEIMPIINSNFAQVLTICSILDILHLTHFNLCIIIPFSTLKIANEAGIPCKIRRSRLLTCLKMLYISATLKFF